MLHVPEEALLLAYKCISSASDGQAMGGRPTESGTGDHKINTWRAQRHSITLPAEEHARSIKGTQGALRWGVFPPVPPGVTDPMNTAAIDGYRQTMRESSYVSFAFLG